MTATTTSMWELAMGAAAKAFEAGDQETGIAKLAYASWLAATTDQEVPKTAADGAYRWITDAAKCFRGGAA